MIKGKDEYAGEEAKPTDENTSTPFTLARDAGVSIQHKVCCLCTNDTEGGS
jgi:hypothetical protein